MITSKLSWLLQLKFKPKPKKKKNKKKPRTKTNEENTHTTNKYRNWQGWTKRKLFPSFKNIKSSLPLSTTMK